MGGLGQLELAPKEGPPPFIDNYRLKHLCPSHSGCFFSFLGKCFFWGTKEQDPGRGPDTKLQLAILQKWDFPKIF